MHATVTDAQLSMRSHFKYSRWRSKWLPWPLLYVLIWEVCNMPRYANYIGYQGYKNLPSGQLCYLTMKSKCIKATPNKNQKIFIQLEKDVTATYRNSKQTTICHDQQSHLPEQQADYNLPWPAKPLTGTASRLQFAMTSKATYRNSKKTSLPWPAKPLTGTASRLQFAMTSKATYRNSKQTTVCHDQQSHLPEQQEDYSLPWPAKPQHA